MALHGALLPRTWGLWPAELPAVWLSLNGLWRRSKALTINTPHVVLLPALIHQNSSHDPVCHRQVPAGDSSLLSGSDAPANGSRQQASGGGHDGISGPPQRLLLPAVVAVTPSPQTLTHSVLTEQQQQPASALQQPRKSVHLQQWEAEQIHYQEQRLWQQQLQAPSRRSQRLGSATQSVPQQQAQQAHQPQREQQQSRQPLVQSASVTVRYPVRASNKAFCSVSMAGYIVNMPLRLWSKPLLQGRAP